MAVKRWVTVSITAALAAGTVGMFAVAGLHQDPAQPAASTSDPIDTIEKLQAFVDRHPENLDAQLALGNAYFGQKDYPRAIQAYQVVVAGRPDHLSARVDMGTAIFYSGDKERAIREYHQALALDPNHLQANFNLGIVYHSQGKLGDAKMAWTKAREVTTDPAALTQIDEKLKSVAWTDQIQ